MIYNDITVGIFNSLNLLLQLPFIFKKHIIKISFCNNKIAPDNYDNIGLTYVQNSKSKDHLH